MRQGTFTLCYIVLYVVETQNKFEQECILLVLKQVFHVMLRNWFIIKPSQLISESSKWLCYYVKENASLFKG